LNRARGDRLLEHLARGGNGRAANDLLREFFYGYPLERLRVLLESDDAEAAKSGAFIASELGDRFAPLFAAVDRMLEHPVKAVRFDALDVVLVNGTREHGATLAKAVVLVRDPEEGVRWQAIRFLSRATEEQLRASLSHLDDDLLAALTGWLVAASAREPERVVAVLGDVDPLTRRFAAAAARRLVGEDESVLRRAADSDDPEVARFARGELDILALDPPNPAR
jgi:hypothetical protein